MLFRHLAPPKTKSGPFYFSLQFLMGEKETADVSRFLLFEASGDSEADADLIVDEQQQPPSALYDHLLDDCDAESCSYEGSDPHNCSLPDQHLSGPQSRLPDDDFDHRDGPNNDEQEPPDVYATSYCDDDEIQQLQHKTSLSVDSGQQLMDEVEKNRRFWEACLAS